MHYIRRILVGLYWICTCTCTECIECMPVPVLNICLCLYWIYACACSEYVPVSVLNMHPVLNICLCLYRMCACVCTEYVPVLNICLRQYWTCASACTECICMPVLNICLCLYWHSVWCAGCYYKGVTYQEKQVWEDGCDYVCECIDGTTGRYSCSEKSAHFTCISVSPCTVRSLLTCQTTSMITD